MNVLSELQTSQCLQKEVIISILKPAEEIQTCEGKLKEISTGLQSKIINVILAQAVQLIYYHD